MACCVWFGFVGFDARVCGVLNDLLCLLIVGWSLCLVLDLLVYFVVCFARLVGFIGLWCVYLT